MKEADELFQILEDAGFMAEEVEGDRILVLKKDLGFGDVRIKSESVAHILEIVFPPMNDLNLFSEGSEEIVHYINKAIYKCGITVHSSAILPMVPVEFDIRTDADSRNRVELTLNGWEVPDHELAVPEFWFSSASTHVHLEVEPAIAAKELTRLYGMEYEVIKAFTNSREFLGKHAYCIRPLAYHHNFMPQYVLAGFPEHQIENLEQHKHLRQTIPGYLRDYSFIALREELGTIEFRTSDSMNRVEDNTRLVNFRLDQWETVGEGLSWEEARKRFFEVCWNGEWN